MTVGMGGSVSCSAAPLNTDVRVGNLDHDAPSRRRTLRLPCYWRPAPQPDVWRTPPSPGWDGLSHGCAKRLLVLSRNTPLPSASLNWRDQRRQQGLDRDATQRCTGALDLSLWRVKAPIDLEHFVNAIQRQEETCNQRSSFGYVQRYCVWHTKRPTILESTKVHVHYGPLKDDR